jgi:glycosyltransferase involved in cell wall biosynthesis
MAAFQGEKFIAAQLASILVQLSEADEVIVVDDCSADRTRDVVRRMADSRVRLLEHAVNQGVTKTFEDALTQATGEVIFLSDQDDLWAADKVQSILDIFQSQRDVVVAASNAALIGQSGQSLGRSYYQLRGQFRSGLLSNLIRCKFLGCTMAFRSELLPKVLPFPRTFQVLHDLWIGSVNSLTGGRTFFLDQNLVLYRRHPDSVTAGKLKTGSRLKNRLHHLGAVGTYWVTSMMGSR